MLFTERFYGVGRRALKGPKTSLRMFFFYTPLSLSPYCFLAAQPTSSSSSIGVSELWRSRNRLPALPRGRYHVVRWCDRTADNEWGALTFRGGPLITHQDVVELCRRCHCRTTLELALALGRYDGSGASEGFRPCFAPSSVQTSIIMSFDFCRCHNHCCGRSLAGA